MTTLTLPALESIGTSLTITGNTAMTTLTLTSLCTVDGDFVVGGSLIAARNPVLDVLTLCTGAPDLAVGGQVVFRNGSANIGCVDLDEVCAAADGPGDEVFGDGDTRCSCE
jgi:hypothetical protein